MEKSIADVVYKILNFNVQRSIGYNAVLSIMDVLVPGILCIGWYFQAVDAMPKGCLHFAVISGREIGERALGWQQNTFEVKYKTLQ